MSRAKANPAKKSTGRTRTLKIEAPSLNCDAIDCTPISIDWREELDENNEGWIAHEAFTCDACNRAVVTHGTGGQDEHRDVERTIEVTDEDGNTDDEPNTCRGHISAEGPAMNYWYPVRIDDCDDAARKIAHLPLCVVEFSDGRTGLALTGGGMDLSWEICAAFVALGYYPPLHFAELPGMAGRGTSDVDRALIAACVESCKIAEGWAVRKRERLGEMVKRARAYARTKAKVVK